MERTFPKLVSWLLVLAILAGVVGMVASLPRGDGGGGGVEAGPVRKTGPGVGALVVLDAGHGGGDGGTVVFGLVEKDLTLDLARRTARELEKRGVRVAMTRDADRTVSLADRVALAEEHPGALFVSLHYNRFRRPGVAGVEAYVTSPKKPVQRALAAGEPARPYEDRRSRSLAERVVEEVARGMEMRSRGVREARFHVIRHAPPPAVLLECGYLSNPQDAYKAARAEGRQRLAELLAQSLADYLVESSENRLLGLAPWSGELPGLAGEDGNDGRGG